MLVLIVLRVACGNGYTGVLLNVIHPSAELVKRDVQSGFFIVFEGCLGRLNKILSRLFFLYVIKNRLFHEVVRSAFLHGGQRCDPIPVSSVELDRDGSR